MALPTGLAQEQLRALDLLSNVPGIGGFYLVGGGAIAFHLGHRTSVDVDLFSDDPRVDLEAVHSAIVRIVPDVEVVARSDAALKLRLAGTEVDLVRYPYATLTAPGVGPAGYRVAGIRDLAAMKLAAVVNRGLRRDFWDLFVIARSGVGLGEMARAYAIKFGRAESDLYHVMRALTFFEDAEAESLLPAGLSEQSWDDIKAYFLENAPALLDEVDLGADDE